MQPGFIPMSLSSTSAWPCATMDGPVLYPPSMVQPRPSAAQPAPLHAAQAGARAAPVEVTQG